jgi:hypothetical protein
VANPFRVTGTVADFDPGLPKLNPGLEFANTFGVAIAVSAFRIWLRPEPRCVICGSFLLPAEDL